MKLIVSAISIDRAGERTITLRFLDAEIFQSELKFAERVLGISGLQVGVELEWGIRLPQSAVVQIRPPAGKGQADDLAE